MSYAILEILVSGFAAITDLMLLKLNDLFHCVNVLIVLCILFNLMCHFSSGTLL